MVRGRSHVQQQPVEQQAALFNYPFPHLMLGLSDRNIGRKCMKSSPSGLCLPLAVMGRQATQSGLTTVTMQCNDVRKTVFFSATFIN